VQNSETNEGEDGHERRKIDPLLMGRSRNKRQGVKRNRSGGRRIPSYAGKMCGVAGNHFVRDCKWSGKKQKALVLRN